MSDDQSEWLKATAHRVSRTVDAPEVIFEAVRRAEMDSKHAALDDLMQ